MAVCAIFGCNNHEKNIQDHGIRFFSFPKDKRIAEEWIRICRRQDKINIKTAKICSIHFTESNILLKYRLLKDESFRGRGLIPNAIPTENLFFDNVSEVQDESNRISNSRIKVNVVDNNIEGNIVNTIEAKDCINTNKKNKQLDITDDIKSSYDSELDPSRTFRCGHCDKANLNFEQLQEHLPSHLNIKPTSKCQLCDELCVNLKKHFKNMHPTYDPLTCLTCNIKFTTKGKLKHHILKTHTNEHLLCDTCGISFNNTVRFKEHCVKHSNLRPYSCEICGKTYKTKPVLRVHSRIHDNHTKIYKYSCEVCGKIFNSTVTLKAHSYIHKNANRYQCHVCDKFFYRKRVLAVHMRAHTGERPYKCNNCDMRFKYNSNYKRHLATHKNIKPYVCETCGIKFRQLISLQTHMKIHLDTDKHEIEKDENGISNINGTTVYPCELCEMIFTTNNSLRVHVRIHFESFKCSECSKKFVSASSLNNHMKTFHAEIKEYKCAQCPKWFNLYSRYKIHLDSHKKPLKCDICGKSYALEAWLMGHKQKCHYAGEVQMES